MKALASVLTALAMLLASTTAWASASDCSPAMKGHRCCCHHGAKPEAPPAHDQLGSEPMRCCDTVSACAGPVQGPPSSAAVQVDAPTAVAVPLNSLASPAATGDLPFLERSRGPPGPTRALYLKNCSFLS